MGICCDKQRQPAQSLDTFNQELKNTIKHRIKKQGNFQWATNINKLLKSSNKDYLYTFQYDNQINDLIAKANQTQKYRDTRTKDDQYKKSLHSSFLVPEDEANFLKQQIDHVIISSFSSQMQKNPSLMLQLDSIFKPFLQEGPFKQNTKLFLSWIEIAENNLSNGFLEPLYSIMADYLIKLIDQNQITDSNILMKKIQYDIQGFVNVMTGVYKQVYKVSIINKSSKGKLFKNQTMNHFTLGNLFKTKDLMNLVRNALIEEERTYLQGFEMRLKLMQGQSFQKFKIHPKFQLISRRSILTESGSVTNVNSYQSAINTLKKITSSQTPTSKLKILLQVQKQIINNIYTHYSELHQQIPQVQPQAINSLTMFVIVKSKVKQLPIDLKIIQAFASKNSMNSISGFYITTFIGAVNMIDSHDD